jgi:heme-degrading monooxygenase HmoA
LIQSISNYRQEHSPGKTEEMQENNNWYLDSEAGFLTIHILRSRKEKQERIGKYIQRGAKVGIQFYSV